MSSADTRTGTMSPETMAAMLTSLQAELAGVKAEMAAKVSSLEDALTGLAHENALLKRRLYGNRTERSHSSELQLTIGDLLADETKLQAELNAAVTKAEADAPPADDRSHPASRGRMAGATCSRASCRASSSRSSTRSWRSAAAGASASRSRSTSRSGPAAGPCWSSGSPAMR